MFFNIDKIYDIQKACTVIIWLINSSQSGVTLCFQLISATMSTMSAMSSIASTAAKTLTSNVWDQKYYFRHVVWKVYVLQSLEIIIIEQR